MFRSSDPMFVFMCKWVSEKNLDSKTSFPLHKSNYLIIVFLVGDGLITVVSHEHFFIVVKPDDS